MGQEFFINSQELETKIRQLLPSQGGAGAGVDLSASTQIIPIIDLTESAEGSNVRADLQTALSHSSITSFNVNAGNQTIINNTGYFRVYGNISLINGTVTTNTKFELSDGSSDKLLAIYSTEAAETSNVQNNIPFDFIVFLKAGDSLKVTSTGASTNTGCTRQIANVTGELVNP
jgi:hypothetical protein